MITGEAKHSRCVMGRLVQGEDVVRGLADVARFERIDAGFVRGQGAVEDAELSLYDARAKGYVPLGLGGAVLRPAEIVSLQGNVSLRDGAPEVRVWAVIAVRRPGSAAPEVVAGFLTRATAVYLEFAFDVYDDGDLERRDDAATGLALWRPPRRR